MSSFEFHERDIKLHTALTGHRQFQQWGIPDEDDVWSCSDCTRSNIGLLQAIEFAKRLPEIEAALIEGVTYVIHRQFEEINTRFEAFNEQSR